MTSDRVTRVLKAEAVLGAREEERERAAAELAAAQERQSAVAEAYAAGHDDGRAAAAREGFDAPPRAAAALEQLVALAARERQAAVDASSRAVLAAAIDIAEWVLRHELSRDTRSLLERLAAASQALLPSTSARVTVSPHDEATVRLWAAQHEVEVHVDASLGPGEARYDSGAGTVEATVPAALRIAAEALGMDPARGPA